MGKAGLKVLSTVAGKQQPKPGSPSARNSYTRTGSLIACLNTGDRGAGAALIPALAPVPGL